MKGAVFTSGEQKEGVHPQQDVPSVDMITPYLDPSPHGHGVGRPADEAIDIAQLQARVHHTCRAHNDGDAFSPPCSGIAMAVLRHAGLTWGDPVWAVGGKACQHSLGRRDKGLWQQAGDNQPHVRIGASNRKIHYVCSCFNHYVVHLLLL
jgi:hypothetical protein